MSIEKIIKLISENSNFEVKKPIGCPKVLSDHVLPDDVKEFYRLCGGISCYIKNGGFPITILSPLEVEQANISLLGKSYDEDISTSWYLIADALDGNYISIDFSPKRLGRCYESFMYTHAIKGNCQIISLSFKELLINLYEYDGDYFFWKDNNKFINLGDAYKEINLK
jgi:hypothetical protein